MPPKKQWRKKQANRVSSNRATQIESFIERWSKVILFLFITLLPTQLGKHFFFDFSFISGIRVDYLAPTVHVTDILALILILIHGKYILPFLRQRKVVWLFGILVINLFFSHNIYLSFYKLVKIFELIALFLIVRKKELSFSSILKAFLIGGVFELGVSIFQFTHKYSMQGLLYFFGERPLNTSMPGIAKASLQGVELLRPYGTFSHPNSMAGFYLLLYTLLLTHPKIKDSLLKYAALLITSLLVLLSFSKVAIGSYVLLTTIHLWRGPLKKHCTFCFIARMGVVIAIALVFLFAQTDPLTLQKRGILMGNALEMIQEYPVAGVGMGNYITRASEFSSKYLDLLNQPVHNIFLLVTSELGLVLFAVAVVIFYREIKNVIIRSPYISALILITGFFDHYWFTLQQNWLLLAVVMGLLL